MRQKTLEMVVFAFLGAILVVGQVALSSLPNIEIVSLLVYIYAKVFGRKALIPVYVFVLIEGLIYGFTIWWVTYLYVWDVLVLASILTKNKDSIPVCAIVTSLFGLSFGLLCSIPTFLIGGPGAGISFFLAGISFDIAHFAGNTLAALLLYKPLYAVISMLAKKMHMAVAGA